MDETQEYRRHCKRKPSGTTDFRPERTVALLRAVFQGWAETGCAAFRQEHVAAHAGAGKTAIYRRWPAKLEFAGDAVQGVEVMRKGVTDRENLKADVDAYLRGARKVLHPSGRRIISDLVAERLAAGQVGNDAG